MLAHIAGIPVEETALSLAPIAGVAGAMAVLRLRRLVKLLPAHGPRGGRASAKGLR